MVVARRFFIRGLVQGVGFRYFAQRSAARHQIHGYVKNLDDGRVESFAQGNAARVEAFRNDLAAGPVYASVDEIEELVEDPDPTISAFRIER